MANQERSPKFNLKMAKSLVGDVAQQTEDVVALQKLADQEDRFWEGLKMSWKTASEIRRLHTDLDNAIDLAMKASKAESSLQLDDGTTCQEVIAEAYNQVGLLEFRLGNFKEALGYFEDSYTVLSTQQALFNIALCQLNLQKKKSPGYHPFEGAKRAREADRVAKQRGLSLLGRLKEQMKASAEAHFISGYYSAEEIIASFNRVIDMDPESDLAIQAGKIITRLQRQR